MPGTGGRSRLRTFSGVSQGAVEFRNWRLGIGLGPTALGSALGCQGQQIYAWESGKCLPDIVLAARIEDLAGVEMRAWTVAEEASSKVDVAEVAMFEAAPSIDNFLMADGVSDA